jgi:hypothetical protein
MKSNYAERCFFQLPKQSWATICYLVRLLLLFIRCMKMCVASQKPYIRFPEVLSYDRHSCLVSPRYYMFVLVILMVYFHGFKAEFALLL